MVSTARKEWKFALERLHLTPEKKESISSGKRSLFLLEGGAGAGGACDDQLEKQALAPGTRQAGRHSDDMGLPLNLKPTQNTAAHILLAKPQWFHSHDTVAVLTANCLLDSI